MQKLKFNSSKEIPALYVNHTDILHVLLNNHGGVILHRFLIMYNISGGGFPCSTSSSSSFSCSL